MARGINHIGLTVPDIEIATAFFKEGLGGRIAYDSQTKMDEPRGGQFVEHVLGLENGAEIVKKIMMVINDGRNIEMFEFIQANQKSDVNLQDIGYTHISFYVADFETSLNKIKQAG